MGTFVVAGLVLVMMPGSEPVAPEVGGDVVTAGGAAVPGGVCGTGGV
ncbi:MAG: hypothetical protein ABFC96_11200 [Thermoguttaceae bacterium]